jgi:predicted dehydrogenase
MDSSSNLWLIGAGGMAVEYAKVLAAQGVSFSCIGRGEASARNFKEKTGIEVIRGGLASFIESGVQVPEYAIVSVCVSELAPVAILLIRYGIKHILLEKPGGLNYDEIVNVSETAKNYNADVKIAYNRRFYASVLAAEEIIKDDGDVVSFNFEFTEWLDTIKGAHAHDDIGDIFLSNSTHVIDLAFFLGGNPREMSCYSKIESHQFDDDASRIFAGAGVSVSNAFFSYQANWTSPGRWNVEVLTSKHRLIFRPMEQLHIQKMKSVVIEKVDIDDALDMLYKPGLYRELEAFFSHNSGDRFLTIHDQIRQCAFYKRIQNKS